MNNLTDKRRPLRYLMVAAVLALLLTGLLGEQPERPRAVGREAAARREPVADRTTHIRR